jgi:homospermidine synthase
MSFPGRILFLGCGSVTQCTLPLLLTEKVCLPEQITVIDMVDNRGRISDSLTAGVNYVIEQIDPTNLDEVLGRYVTEGDICLDLAWNIETCTIVEWCRDHGVRYLNTSVEVWDPYGGAADVHPLERTLYVRHMEIRKMIARWGDNRGPSAVVEHGANPGLVSHWTKQALGEIAMRALVDGRTGSAAPSELEAALAASDHPRLAQLLSVKVIHIAERDSQVTSQPKQVDEFVNTWSVDGFYEEGVAPAELGWGTHERRLPPDACVHAVPATRSASLGWEPRHGSAREFRRARSSGWSSATARRSRSPIT